MLMWIKARNDGSQGRTAHRCGHVSPGERQSFTGQLVNVRGLDMRVVHKSVIRPGLVVGKDIDDVGEILLGGC